GPATGSVRGRNSSIYAPFAYICRECDPGSASKRLYDLVRALAAAGHQVLQIKATSD
ncbi:hypothetical protein A245_13450, partial [Pseudomonas syringae pv. actinidiae ICMP 19096]